MTAAPRPRFGAWLDAAGATFRFWAPSQREVGLQLGASGHDRLTMQRSADGWHEATLAEVRAGDRYGFVVDGHQLVPDPASRCNPDGVHGLSEIVDIRAHDGPDGDWRGRPWHEAVVYELHVGTFTAEGSYAAAAERLEALSRLGVTAIELMPIAACPGERNWGYDGVLHYAPHPAYGTPAELRDFIARAHRLGLMVLLDVVYNHFGPDGNYLHGYCPEFFNPRHQTPWGAAINFDGDHCDAVRAFYVGNALHWIEAYGFDGLRLDAVHAIADDSPRHIVDEIAAALRDGPGRSRHVHLVLENERNQVSLLAGRGDASGDRAEAQWNDDFHHAGHVLLTGETDSYYADYADRPCRRFATALAEGFVYQGQASPFRDGKPHGEPSAALPSTAFVSFLQNHDQVGNRAFGERIDRLADADRLDAAYACLLLSPQVPMLFMGEEFAASTPFLYFCAFAGELAGAISRGRRAEFARFAAFADPEARERIPDPVAPETFLASKLPWSERDEGAHARRLAHVGRLLALRAQALVPGLAGGTAQGVVTWAGDDAFAIAWTLADGSRWLMHANFGDRSSRAALPEAAVAVFASEGARVTQGVVELAAPAVWIGRVAP